MNIHIKLFRKWYLGLVERGMKGRVCHWIMRILSDLTTKTDFFIFVCKIFIREWWWFLFFLLWGDKGEYKIHIFNSKKGFLCFFRLSNIPVLQIFLHFCVIFFFANFRWHFYWWSSKSLYFLKKSWNEEDNFFDGK